MKNSVSVETLRADAKAIFETGVEAANPSLAVRNHLDINTLTGKIHIIAFGKAACAMIKAAYELIPADALSSALAVTNYENVTTVDGVEVMSAGHPLPDKNGFRAAQKVAQIAQQASADETILVLISGGGSALLPYPVNGISLAEKIATTNLLLSCGATIQEMNTVRKHLSVLKGGGLAKLAFPAKVHALILSDVLGDDLSTIASGITVPDDSTFADAQTILKKYACWEKLPETVCLVLSQAQNETPKTGDPIFQTCDASLCGSNAVSVKALMLAAQNCGYQTQLYSSMLCGIARDEAEKLVLYAKKLSAEGLKTPTAILAGGETTVILKGSGKGGRNQEFALAFALAAEKYGLQNWTFLSGGTDGRDAETNAAGGLVDAHSLNRMRKSGIHPQNALENNDSYTALKSSGDLVITGATGTNVADLQVLLIHPSLTK